ncbi:hypothetical protein HYPBUDRAFT_240009 [Hyphopichia burtonii NRRL Y-1933]|uniref:PhoD-like phosphatase domain-containing protein n=1 Tax=Hyphopichia burtonii NRRL Y-1933 TaxID=984485 RepID=A0A1E4RL06_9ASCO|nr:hypothetical protein HYPBUDRAFT_240009 [Hyphopichia burtonii NRRL Y-1933]ODV67958.1 hypothetical protein HYPBUDRAFT_240009 [Hyphopichia burtonii NRRL Y-1933]
MISKTNDDWFEPIPIDEYILLNKHSSDNIPDTCPIDEALPDGLDVRCGPILRLLGTLENGESNYRGSIMLVVKKNEIKPKITFKIGNASNEEVEPTFENGEFPSVLFFEQDEFEFWRFNINLNLVEYEQKIQYYINGTFKKSQQFFIPAVNESMNVVSFSCNGFSLGTDTSNYKSSLWLDVLKKHAKQHYHVMLGGGDQIYCDSIKIKSSLLEEWANEISVHKKREWKVSDDMLKQFENYYLHAYLDWFGKGYWVGTNGKTLQKIFPLTMAQIPSVNIYDDHDIIDGFGSYADATMAQDVFATIGNVAYKYYMLFQHQISLDEKAYSNDPSWILGNKQGPYIKQPSHSNFMRLGKEISLVGIDCRTERKLKQIVSPSTYNLIFQRLNKEIKQNPETKHLLVMLGVPILYPRLVWLEAILTNPVLKPIKKLAARGIINRGLVNEFDGGVEVLDDLNDHWCSKNHKRERNELIKNLMEFGAENGVRITILSGDVHLCCIGRLKSKYYHHPHSHPLHLSSDEAENKNFDTLNHPQTDARLIFNVISSAIINAPPPSAMASLLDRRSKIHHFNKDTDEDIIPIFNKDTDGSQRDNLQFLNKRNWSDLILAKQSYLYKDQVDQGISKFPSSLFDDDLSQMEKRELNERYVKYPLLNDSLVTTLHVENDGNDFEANTASYEVLIPKLEGKYTFDSAPIKHLA